MTNFKDPNGGHWDKSNADSHTERKLMPHKRTCEMCGQLLKRIDGKWVCVTETCGSPDGKAK